MDLTQFDGHTPGPLFHVEVMAWAAGFEVEDGEGRTVARIMKAHGAVPLPARANAALIAAAPELLAEVRRLTAEADALRRERDELTSRNADLAARLAKIEAQPPVAWQSRFTDGGGWGYCSEQHAQMVAAAPHEWPGYEVRALFARPATAPGATPGSAEEFATSDDPRCRDGSAACIDCLMRGDCLMSSAQRSAAAPERAEPDHLEDARGMVCATRGVLFGGRAVCHFIRCGSNECNSPDQCEHQRPQACRCGPDGCSDSVACPKGGA